MEASGRVEDTTRAGQSSSGGHVTVHDLLHGRPILEGEARRQTMHKARRLARQARGMESKSEPRQDS